MSLDNVKDALTKTMAGIQSSPNSSNVVFRADTEWMEDVRCMATVRDFDPIIVDEPPELGGQDTSANPVELVLVALGTCQEIMYAAYASVMDIQLDSVKVSARGYLDLKGLFGLDPAVPAGYKRITFETQIESPADEDKLRALIETVESRCPVLDILSRAQSVTGTAVANGQVLHNLATNAA